MTKLSVSIFEFRDDHGQFRVRGNSGGIEAAANGVTALLNAGPASVGANGRDMALLLGNDGTKVLEASGALPVQRGEGFRQRSATSVLVDWNTTTTDYSAAPLTVAIRGDQRDDPRGSEHAKRGGDGVERQHSAAS